MSTVTTHFMDLSCPDCKWVTGGCGKHSVVGNVPSYVTVTAPQPWLCQRCAVFNAPTQAICGNPYCKGGIDL